MFIGNQKIVNVLARSLEKKQVAQAYIFAGPESVGKFLLARIWARSLVYGEKFSSLLEKAEQGGAVGNLPDIIIVKPEIVESRDVLKEKEIGLDQIRSIRGFLFTYPLQGYRKVLIINDAHRLTEAAQNSLLKILEEPNSTCLIILVTHDEEKILPTIKSRCQKIIFGLVLKKELEEIFTSDKPVSLELGSLLAMGRPGAAIQIKKSQSEIWQIEELEFIEKLKNLDILERLKKAESMAKNIIQSQKILSLWVWYLRWRSWQKKEEAFQNFAAIEKIEDSQQQLSVSGRHSRLILENLLINILS